MKAIFHLIIIAAVLTAPILPAAVPSTINYQGRLTNVAGIPQSGTRAMSVKLYDAATNGTLLYSEDVGNVTVDQNGIYGFQFGASSSNFADALAASHEQWLELLIDGVAQVPRQKILAVPYALVAGSLPAGAVKPPMIADGAVGSAQLEPELKATIEGKASAAMNNLTIPGPYLDRADAIAHGVVDGSLYYRTDGTVLRAALFPPLTKFCAVGDSITDNISSGAPLGYDTIRYNNNGWGAILEHLSNRRFVSVGPTSANPYKTGILKDRDHGYSGITAYYYMNGSPYLPQGFRPIDDALACNPDVYIVHIGTNDVDHTPATIIARVRAVWAALVASGKPVIGTDILQRAAYHNTPAIRDKIIAVNAGLRKAWKTDGLLAYRQWDDLLDKDPETGYATQEEFPGAVDGIHPTMRVGLKLGRDLHNLLSPYYAGTPPIIPAYSSSAWATPYSNLAGGTTLATGWNSQFVGDVGTDVKYSKITDLSGDWQRVEIVNPIPPSYIWDKGVWTRQAGAGITWNVGDRCVATATFRVPSGTGIGGVGFTLYCVGASESFVSLALFTVPSNPSPMGEFNATIYSDPFTIPTGTTELWMIINFAGGPGMFDFQKAGIFRIP